MEYTSHYQSPIGNLLLVADQEGLTGLWFDGEKPETREGELSVFEDARRWLDLYFKGVKPDFLPRLHLTGTEFQLKIWNRLLEIPYGMTTTYGAIAGEIAREREIDRMSAQAVGGAVGHNKISIIIPCHRVVGSDRSLVGYGGGMDKKKALLRLEGIKMDEFTVSANI